MMDEKIRQTAEYVEKRLRNFESAHDWRHVQKVWRNAKIIALSERADLVVVELAALLHDIADYKFHGGDESIGHKLAEDWLISIDIDDVIVMIYPHILEIFRNISYMGPTEKEHKISVEHAVVHDADRLEAIGAIGIARTFAFGGYSGHEIFNPEIKPNLKMSRQQYKQNTSPTINHFFEKLLLVKERMLTETGKRLAQERHEFMKEFLHEFFNEWYMSEEIPNDWIELITPLATDNTL